MFHSFHLAVQNGRGTFWFLPRKYFDPNLTTICCEKQWTELHIMEFYSFYCVYYVYYLQFYTLFPAFEADGIQEVSGSIPLISTNTNPWKPSVSKDFFALGGNRAQHRGNF